MTPELVVLDVVIYNAQVAAFIGVAALLPWAFRLRAPRPQLAFWYAVLAGCLLLPFVQPWLQAPVQSAAGVTANTVGFTLGDAPDKSNPFSWRLGWAAAVVLLLAAGAAIRFCLLGLGILKLHRLRKHAERLECAPSIERATTSTGVRATFLYSEEIAGPVTFGIRCPAVLVPPGFFQLELGEQESVAVHELLHVRRHDWLFTVAEECVRAILWFHPAIWFLLNRIQLAREQAVDEAVVQRTRRAQEYVGALLKIAAARIQPDLAPAPLFLKKRHLRERVAAIVQGESMSKTKLTLTLIAVFSVLPLVAGVLAWQLPLQAAPQEVRDAQGVEVRTGSMKILHRTSVEYPSEALQKGVSGEVTVAVSVNRQGEVTDAKVVSGPEELRKPVLQSVLGWHFASDSTPAQQPFAVAVAFTAPSGSPVRGAAGNLAPRTHKPVVVERIDTSALPQLLRDRVESAMPVRVGEIVGPERFSEIERTLQSIDSHIFLQGSLNNDKAVLRIALANGAGQFASSATSEAGRIRVGGNVQAMNLTTKVTPAYPPLAKEARVQGTVRFEALIAKDGHIQNLQLMTGHPLLVPAATEAVKQWVYKPTLLNGEPVEVITQIDVNFTLTQ